MGRTPTAISSMMDAPVPHHSLPAVDRDRNGRCQPKNV